MLEFLKICGLKDSDIQAELPRIQRAFNRLGITAEDIKQGKSRLYKYYDIELEGIRKALRLCLLELVDSVLAREERGKVVFGFNAPGFEVVATALVSNSREVYSAHLAWAFQLFLGCIFDKFVPVLEAAEERWLKEGLVGHCGNPKTIVGLTSLGFLPKPDLMVTTGYLCETAPKTVDLFREIDSIPVFCCDTCQDRDMGEYDVATLRSVKLAAKSLRNLVVRVQDIVGFEINDDMLNEVLDAKRRFVEASRRLRVIIENSDPIPLAITNETIWMCLRMLTLSVDRVPEAIDAVNTACTELEERVAQGIGVVEKGSPRIILTLPTHHTDPRFEYLIGEMGIAIVSTDPHFVARQISRAKDPYEAVSQSFQMSLYTTLSQRIALLIEECKMLKVDGVLGRFHKGCRHFAGDAVMVKNAVEKELGIPVLLMEWENFDPRVYNHDKYRKELEAFKLIMTQRST